MIIALISGIVCLALLFVDLITKAWAYAVSVQQSNYFLGFIRMNYLPGGNTGIAWGMFGSSEAAMIFITVLTALLIVGIAAAFFTVFKKNTPARICLAVIEAGAIGNFIDRIVLGYVRDFVDVSPIGFGICNFADFFITFGAVALFIVLVFVGKDALIPLGKWRKTRMEEKEKKQPAQTEQNHDEK